LLSVTADTNIYVSAFEFGGQPRNFLDLARAGIFRLDISGAIKQEVLRVLGERLRYSSDALREVEVKLDSIAGLVIPTKTLDVIKADPPDNRILECAVAAKSDFIVSGDAHHVLPLVSYNGIPIVKVAAFLELLKREQA
jgi:putative PIN family toxin of toxin-antitoxin system